MDDGSKAEKARSTGEKEDEEEEEMDVPDNFFDEFEDNEFVDHLIDSVLPDKDEENHAKAGSTSREKRSSSPMVERCLQEIDKLTKDIQRRKRKLEREMTKEQPSSSTDIRRRRSPSPGRSAGRKWSPHRRIRTRSRSRSPDLRQRPASYRPRSPLRRSRSRERRRITYTSSRISPHRKRTRPDSPVAGTSTKSSMTFMEELEKKFAEQGKAFPEKYLLLGAQKAANMSNIPRPRPPLLDLPMPVSTDLIPPLPTSVYPPYQSHGYYGGAEATQMYMYPNYSVNPMTPIIAPSVAPMPIDPPVPTKKPPPPPPVMTIVRKKLSSPPADEFLTETFSDRVLNRCIEAIKLLRADENKVPKKKFLFTPSSKHAVFTKVPASNTMDNPKNVQFRLSASRSTEIVAPLTQLSGCPRDIARVLGFDGTQISSEIKLKHLGDQVIIDFEEELNKEKATFVDTGCQTLDYRCEICEERDSRKRTVHSTQTEAEPTKATRSIRSQTNEQNYRDPLFRKLSAMSSAQLVAVADYVRILNAPQPANAAEIFKLREELMDVYNLAGRDDEQVRVAERDRLNSVHQKAFNNSRENSSSKSMKSMMNMNTTITVPNDNYNGSDCGNIGYRRGDNNNFRDSNNFYNGGQDDFNSDFNQQQQQQQMMHNQRQDQQMNMNSRRQEQSDMDFQMQLSQEENRERELRMQQLQYEEDVRMFQMEQDRLMNNNVVEDEFDCNFDDNRGRGGGGGGGGGGESSHRGRTRTPRGSKRGGFRGKDTRPFRGRGGRGSF